MLYLKILSSFESLHKHTNKKPIPRVEKKKTKRKAEKLNLVSSRQLRIINHVLNQGVN